MSLLNSINKGWFVNLSKSPIPHEIQVLLQLSDKFCLPPHHNSQRFNFIKNTEYNILRLHPDTASNIRCLSVHTLNNLFSSPPTLSNIDSRLIFLIKKRFF